VNRSDTGQTEQAADDDNPNAPAWAIAPTPASQPVQTTVNQVPVAPDSRGAAITLPFVRTTGAAALRRGDDVIVVFDENRPIDLAPLHGDPVFGTAAIQLLQNATLLRVHLLPNNDLRLTKVPLGWNVWIGPRGDVMDTPLQTLGSSVAASQMQFSASQPSKVVVIPDPDTGGNLLIGTQRSAGEAVPMRRRTPDFDVVPSLQGVVIAPTSDRPQLQVAPPGFVLAGVDRPLALSDNTTLGTALADAATLTRRFNIQPLPLLILRQTLKNRIDESAATPPLARLAKRRATAEAYLGLGMGAEAQAMMRLAVMDDPRGNDDPDALALGAMGAILAGRNDAAEAINDPRLTGTDEIKFWRAVRLAQKQADSKAAAIDFADTDRLALAYPDLLRDALLPLVAETEVSGGQLGAATALLDKRKDDAGLLLARAFLLRARGDTAGALAVLDKLAMSHDRLLRFRASVAAIDLRLTSKKITATEAADAAEKLLFAWRGDDRERDMRFQVAAWRFQAGQWSAALAMLRESAESFPERRNQYRRQITETLRGLMRDDRLIHMDSIQLISLLEDNKELLPDGAEGQLAAVEMADRMAQLDLDERALPLLEKLAKTTPSLPARAAFGLRLASLYLAAGDAKATQTALSESGSSGLGPELVERRDILAARADAVSGNLPSAVAALTAVGSVAADLARADIEETAKDWPGAEAALTSYVSRTVPPEGKLSPEQGHSILRLAAAMAQAGDEAGLGALRTQYAERMQATPDAAAFRLLTEAPVRDVTDLPRSAKELAAARTGVAAPARP
jgi:tetratricopeptide (TPR) repeat protein